MNLLSQTKLPAILENLNLFIEPVSHCAQAQGFGPERVSEIELALEEALVNIVSYSYPKKNGDVEVTCSIDYENRFVIDIMNWGVPFNPLSTDEPDLISDIPERKVGGLGIFMIRELMDDVKYRFKGDKNMLTLVVNKDPG